MYCSSTYAINSTGTVTLRRWSVVLSYVQTLLASIRRPTYLTVGRVTTQLSVPSMPNAHGFAGQKEIAQKTPSLALQLHCHNSFQPLKHQPYHIQLPITINIRLWEAFVLGVYNGALESFRFMYCRRSSSCATALRRVSFSSKLLPTVGIVLPSQFYVDVVMRNKSTHTHTDLQ